MSGPVSAHGAGVRISLKVIPRSPRNAISGIRDGRLLLRVTAPPVDSAANDAVLRLLADELKVPGRAVKLVAGETSRHKTVEVSGITAKVVQDRLSLWSDAD